MAGQDVAIGSGMRLVAATGNPAKLAVMRAIGAGLPVDPPPAGIPWDDPEPPADETDPDPFPVIAAAKALAVSRMLPGATVIASDGGLLVPGLGDRWRPERTRRFAGPGANDDDRVRALLDLARDLSGPDRRIGWREAVALARDGHVLLVAVAEGTPGLLAREPLPADGIPAGFWVPRVWLGVDGRPVPNVVVPGHWRRLAELVGPFLRGLAPDGMRSAWGQGRRAIDPPAAGPAPS